MRASLARAVALSMCVASVSRPVALAGEEGAAPPAQPPGVPVTGVVLDDQEKPVTGARLTALEVDADRRLDPFKPDIDVTTDGDGRFEAKATPGTYFVLARKERLTSDGGPWSERRWTVRSGKPLEGLVLHLKAGGCVTGRVTHKDTGAPLDSAGVVAESGATATIDRDGRFALLGLAQAEHTLKVISPGLANTHQDINTTGKPDYDVAIEMSRGYSLRGRVTDEAGQPIAGALVRDNYSGSVILCWMQHTLTAADGSYELTGYPFTRKLWSMMVSHKDFAEASKGDLDPPAQGDVLTVDFMLGQGFAVAGEVSDQAGRPVPDALVNYSGNTSYVHYRDTHADEEGRFNLTRIAEGREDAICVLAKGFAPADQRATPGKGDGIPFLTFALALGHGASGRVVDAEGKPIAGAVLHPQRTLPGLCGSSYFGAQVTTDAEGHFKLDSLPADGVTVDVLKAGCSSVRRAPIMVDGETEIRMDRPGVIRGRVVEETTGTPVTSFNVRLGIPGVSTSDRPQASFSAHLSRRGQDCRADDGSFTIGDDLITRAAHVVIVTAPGYATTRVEEVIAQPTDWAEWPLTIKLAKGALLAGTVTDAETGNPVGGADLLLIRPDPRLPGVPLEIFEERDLYPISIIPAHASPDGRFEFRIGANEGKVLGLLVRHRDYAPTLLKDITLDTSPMVRLARGGTILCKAGAVPGFTAGQWRVSLTVGSLLIGGKQIGTDGAARFVNVPAGLDGRLQLSPPGRTPVMAPVKALAGETVEVDFANLSEAGKPK